MILAALNEYYERLAPAGKVPPYGFTTERISSELLLARDGTLLSVNDLRDTSGKKPRPRLLPVPQSFKRPGTTPKPFFLWDKTAFVLGLEAGEPGSGNPRRTPEQHSAFKEFHASVLQDTDDEGLKALLAFLERWQPAQFTEQPRFPVDFLQASVVNVVFRLEDDRCFLHERPAATACWTRLLADEETPSGQCLVTGSRVPIARLHPAIKGVDGAQSSGASIVSFNLDAFESYGKTQGDNAPVSQAAAFAYTTALNHLLRSSAHNRQRLQVGDATVVFWAIATDEASASRAESLFAAMAVPPDNAQEAEKLRNVLLSVASGQPLAELVPGLEPDTRFYVLGLAPNASRLSVRFWQTSTLETFVVRFAEHYADLELTPVPWRTPPAVWRLLCEIAAQGKAENVPPQLAGEFMRAILTGGRYPRSLFAHVVMRMRAESETNRMQLGLRVALCKAVLTRDFRKGVKGVGNEVPAMLNQNETNAGYRLGRLFAILENAQRAALGDQINATIRDRYYGAASATPAAIFPVLLRNANHHFGRLRKDGRGAIAFTLERNMGDILSSFHSEFPRSLRLEDQGRFAIGYYHQRFSRRDEPSDEQPARED